MEMPWKMEDPIDCISGLPYNLPKKYTVWGVYLGFIPKLVFIPKLSPISNIGKS